MGVRTFQVDVPAPYRLDLTVWTLRRRAHNEIDRWDGSSYSAHIDGGGAVHRGNGLSTADTAPPFWPDPVGRL